MDGLPPLPVELRNRVCTAPDPAGALADWSSQDHIGIAVPDLTRSLPLQKALETLSERAPNHQVVIGLGLHRRMTEEELAPLQRWDITQHDPDDCIPTVNVMGVPGAVGRNLAQTDWKISVGVCELHQYAGLSGGHKGISIGCGGRQTIETLHHRDRIVQPGVEVGRLDGNPFRNAIDLLGRAAGCRLALNWVPALRLWMAGPPESVVREALSRMKPWQNVAEPAPGARLRVPPSKARSLYQASRAATYLGLSPNPPLQPEAIIAIEASCEEGLGSESGFVDAIKAHEPPWTRLLTGEAPQGAGAQRAVMLALLARRYRIRIYGCTNPDALRKQGFWACGEPAPCEPGWLDVPAPFHRLPQLMGPE